MTAAGHAFYLDLPFFVAATQNPIEQEGTYPLPEAQLDRFMFNIEVGYPSRDEELMIVDETTSHGYAEVKPVFSKDDVIKYQELVRRIPVSRHVLEFAIDLAKASRPKDPSADAYVKEYVEWGAGPRASQYLILGAKSRALLTGKPTPSCDDVRACGRTSLAPSHNCQLQRDG